MASVAYEDFSGTSIPRTSESSNPYDVLLEATNNDAVRRSLVYRSRSALLTMDFS